ncbi:hypothetical protein [Aureispira anguillae]|nr:hypothetical protein [Aureispira anguillae]
MEQKEEGQKRLEDSLALIEQEKRDKAKEEKLLDSLSYEWEKALLTFLGLKPSRSDKIHFSDTLLTFYHDISFSGFLGGKFTQIFRRDSMIYLTQAFYTNQGKKGEESLSLTNHLTGEYLGKVYRNNIQHDVLTLEKWNAIISTLEDSNFMRLGIENCGRLALDGSYSALTFHSKTETHSVHRQHCPDHTFFKIIHQIDSLLLSILN